MGFPRLSVPDILQSFGGGGVTDTAGPGGVVDNLPLHLGRGDSGDSMGTAGAHCLSELHEALGLRCGRRAVALHLLYEHGGGTGGGVGCQLPPPDGFYLQFICLEGRSILLHGVVLCRSGGGCRCCWGRRRGRGYRPAVAKHSSRFVSAAPRRALCCLRDLLVLLKKVIHGGLPRAVALDLPFIHELRLDQIGCVDACDKVGYLVVVRDVDLISFGFALALVQLPGKCLDIHAGGVAPRRKDRGLHRCFLLVEEENPRLDLVKYQAGSFVAVANVLHFIFLDVLPVDAVDNSLYAVLLI